MNLKTVGVAKNQQQAPPGNSINSQAFSLRKATVSKTRDLSPKGTKPTFIPVSVSQEKMGRESPKQRQS